MDKSYFLSNLWRWKCRLEENTPAPKVDFQELKKTEWSDEFEHLMRNRMLVGSFRYGRLNRKKGVKYDRIGSMLRRLENYQKTGNKENLVDVANICLCEFVECVHPKAHFESVDDGGHAKRIN